MKKKLLFITFVSQMLIGQTAKNYLHRGTAALRQKKATIAKEYLLKAIEMDPDNLDALFKMGVILFYEHKKPEACNYFEHCLRLQPDNKSIVQNYATILNHFGEYDTSKKLFEKILDTDRRNSTVLTKLPHMYIRDMDWYYAMKFIRTNTLWWHDKDLKNQTVLLDLVSEWNGLGDAMQMVRYAKHLHQAGAIVTVQVLEHLAPLLSLCPYISKVIKPNEKKPITDQTYELLTDRFLICTRNTLYQPSQDVPYLFAHPILIKKWKSILRNDRKKIKIGICWQSNKMEDYFSGKLIPGPRSFPLETLVPILSIPNTKFYSLQMEQNKEIDTFNSTYTKWGIHRFRDLDEEYGNFMDTAAIMTQLDLVITVDTSIAHLAGGLGVPVWVLLPYAADFRWFRDRTDSPLYPTMRLFRQHSYKDWDSAIFDLEKALGCIDFSS